MNKRSIVARVQFTYIIIILIISTGFIFSLYERNITSEKYDEYANINIKLSSLTAEFNESWDGFDGLIRTSSDDDFKKYSESNSMISEIMNSVRPYVVLDRDSGIYLRNLDNMFDYYKTNSGLLMNQMINSQQLDENSYKKLTELKTLYYYINKHSELLEVSYLNYSNQEYSSTVKKYKDTQVKIYSILIVIVLISFGFTMIISRNLGRTIGKLRRYAELLSDAKWEIPDINEQKYYEINSLANAFNKMKNSIREFINELNEKAEMENNYHIEMRRSAEKDKLIKETQLLALQSQMDPHFLFNTLNTISRVAMFESAEDTVKLIEAASKILRYNLDYKDKLVNLKDEIRMIKAYVTLQETRFQDQMSFSFDIDDNLEPVKVPPMLIQPMVENAINHGLREKDKEGMIKISVKKKELFISIRIIDNGIGMDHEKIESLLNEDKSDGRRLGVLNVKKRLELYYNRTDLFKIRSQRGEGTEVTILIPIESGEGNVKTVDC